MAAISLSRTAKQEAAWAIEAEEDAQMIAEMEERKQADVAAARALLRPSPPSSRTARWPGS